MRRDVDLVGVTAFLFPFIHISDNVSQRETLEPTPSPEHKHAVMNEVWTDSSGLTSASAATYAVIMNYGLLKPAVDNINCQNVIVLTDSLCNHITPNLRQ